MATLKNTTIAGTGAIQLPVGTTAQRPAIPSSGQMRYNSTFKVVEIYDGTRWRFMPDIVRDGLVLYLDAGEPSSYPGSGTTWTDLSGAGNNGTLVNGASYSTVNGGVIVLDGVDDYVDISSINLSSSNYTVIGAARYVTVTNGRTFSGRNNNWLMGQWNSTTENYYAEGWVSSVGSGAGDTNWRIYAATGDISADSYALYVNGVLSSGPNNGGAQGPNGFTIGRYGPGASEHSNSHIGFLLCYNRVLTASEILQNFNATRSRFGI